VDWIHLNIAGRGVSLNIADVAIQAGVPIAIAATLIASRRIARNRTAAAALATAADVTLAA
jgi:hypothetical protein